MRAARLVFRLRPEEAVALAFLLPTTWLTLAAFFYAREAGVLGPRYPGGVVRLTVVVVLLGGLALALRRFPGSRLVAGLRETLPLFACFLIYTNRHDTIGFVNPHDVHDRLVAFDQWLSGLQPCVWAQQLITRGRTELMSFFYVNFAWLAPSTPVILLALGRRRAFRAATVGILTCFFMGYFLYDRVLNHLLGGHQGSVESFHVAHLQDKTLRFSQSDQFIGLLEGARDGLLQEDIDSLKE